MDTRFKPVPFNNNILILGFGCIAQACLPVLFKLIKLKPTQVTIISRSPDKTGLAKKWKVNFVVSPLKEDSYKEILDSYLKKGDFLLNLSVNVSSLALLEYCWRQEILYLD